MVVVVTGGWGWCVCEWGVGGLQKKLTATRTSMFWLEWVYLGWFLRKDYRRISEQLYCCQAASKFPVLMRSCSSASRHLCLYLFNFNLCKSNFSVNLYPKTVHCNVSWFEQHGGILLCNIQIKLTLHCWAWHTPPFVAVEVHALCAKYDECLSQDCAPPK